MQETKQEKHASDVPDSLTDIFGDTIFAYTRKQAIEDGVLVDVSETAREAGFRCAFAMTAEVWGLIEHIPRKHCHEDVAGRLWDVLMVARASIRGAQGQDVVFFDVILHHDNGNRIRLKLHIGPGDNGCEPVLTLMLPEQD